MKPGDLRQFNDNLSDGTFTNFSGSSLIFMVIEIWVDSRCPRVNLLLNGRLEDAWDYIWVYKNSKAIDETW